MPAALALKARLSMIRRGLPITIVSALALTACAHPSRHAANPPVARNHDVMRLVATAYCQTGRTASGLHVRPGIVAADPTLLPLGSIVEILEPNDVGGAYTVADTGAAIKGAALDIYMRDCQQARRFGRKKVSVWVVQRGRT